MTARLLDRLTAIVGPAGVQVNRPLAPLTTFHVGGPADFVVEARDPHQIVQTLDAAREAKVAITLLGGGSNVWIGDRGIRGIVLIPKDRSVGREDDAGGAPGVRAGAGLTINGLVRWTIGQGLAGLEAWAGTPGVVGGAIYGNAHFKGRLIGDLVREVRLIARDG